MPLMGRAMAVVLFTDLVGSTELRGRLGEEAAHELRRRRRFASRSQSAGRSDRSCGRIGGSEVKTHDEQGGMRSGHT
ncbi:MAG: hypothetical protein LC792_21275 [Actinobacteria bacterium]|nr:hypothetical protein [Actinomycetota bacterium]